ncbi:CoA pyrophosphatase [Vibrio sp.]|nr:CoA pyrophosphatase [Vibrio sp.]
MEPITSDDLVQYFQIFKPPCYNVNSLKITTHLRQDTLRKAAVFIGFVERKDHLSVVLTRRAKHLKHHPGQICFPGGKYEDGDMTLAQTALRETHEELGIPAQQIRIIGQMRPITSISRFSVTPIVGLLDPNFECTIDPNEVDEVFEVPAEHLLDHANLCTSTHQYRGIQHEVLAIPYLHYFIWGMTAQIIEGMQRHLNFNFSLKSEQRKAAHFLVNTQINA